MQINQAALESIYFNLALRYNEAFQGTPVFWDRLATLIPSTTKENRYAWLAMVPRMREWIGERLLKNIEGRSYSLVNRDFENTLEIDRNDVEDDNLGLYAPGVAMLGQQSKKWPDDLIIEVLQGGKTRQSYDGQFFFDTDHPHDMSNPGLGTYANLFTGTPLTADNAFAVYSAMTTVKGEDNRPLAVMPNLLIVPPILARRAREIANADIVANTAGTAGVSNVLKGTWDILVVPELANEPTVWYMADTNKAIKPFIFQQRKAPTLVSLTDPTLENVFMRRKFLYGVDARGAAGFSLPFLIARAEG